MPEGLRSPGLRFYSPSFREGSEDRPLVAADVRAVFWLRYGPCEKSGEEDNDEVYGAGGADSLYGDTGNDLLNGGDDSDQMMGFDGRDTMEGGNGNDLLNGRDGTQFNDRLDGEAGTNRCVTDPDFAVNCEVQWEKHRESCPGAKEAFAWRLSIITLTYLTYFGVKSVNKTTIPTTESYYGSNMTKKYYHMSIINNSSNNKWTIDNN